MILIMVEIHFFSNYIMACHKLCKSAVLKTIFQNRKKGYKKNKSVSLSQI